MNSFRLSIAMLALSLCHIAAPSAADQSSVQDCHEATLNIGPTYAHGPDCKITWLDNNQLQTIIWRQVETDFQAASLDQTGTGRPVLTSSLWPELVDVDQDGWLDLITFTPVGMVNGTYDIFLYDPKTYKFDRVDPVTGHTLERDKLGYLVVTGRSGAGWINRFYTFINGKMAFLFELEPYGLGRSGGQFGERCDVSLGYQRPLRIDDILASNQVPDGAAFFAYYCDTDPKVGRTVRTVRLQEDPASTDRVPENTAFYCVLEGGTHAVSMTQGPHTLFYAYGPLGGEPELELARPINEVRIRPVIQSGQSRFGDVTFTNGAYEYMIYYNHDLSGDGRSSIPSADNTSLNGTYNSGLSVYHNGDTTAPVFQNSCILQRSYNAIFPPPMQ